MHFPQINNTNHPIEWDHRTTLTATNYKKNAWIQNIQTWLSITLLTQETVQTFGAKHTL